MPDAEVSIVIAGGGTGGHVYPGIALADAIIRQRPQARVVFVGTERGMESVAVPAAGFGLELIDVLPWARTIGAKRFVAPATAVRAAAQARRILRARRVGVVAAMGGYASLPVALAARTLRIPVVVHEQNAVPGRANRITARFAAAVGVTFAGSARYFNRGVDVTGNPLRPAIARMDRAALRAEALAAFGLDPGRKTLLVTGGSQGAKRLSDAARALALLWTARDDRQILLIAGRENAAAAAFPPLREVEFVDRMELAFAAADAVVCRAGAGVMEVACAGVPAVLVPYPYARDDHQRANAAEAAAAGAAVILDDAGVTAERLDEEASRIFDDEALAQRMAASARAFARPDAAEALAGLVLRAAEGAA